MVDQKKVVIALALTLVLVALLGTYYLAAKRKLSFDFNFGFASNGVVINQNAPVVTVARIIDGQISGTAFDPDSQSQPIKVEFYFDFAKGPGVTDELANVTSTEANGDFAIDVPASLHDGKKHFVYVYAHDLTDGAPTAEITALPFVVRP